MPELPEVETVRRGLVAAVAGRTVTRVDVLHPRPVRRHSLGPDDFAATLQGRTFAEPRRRGKYLWLPFDDADALLAHLGMSGQFRVNAPADPLVPNTRVLFTFEDDREQVRFVDQRMFGGLSLSPGGAELPSEVAHIGRDLFDPLVDDTALARLIRSKRSGIKRVLLDQRVTSGIGNIYADEALWAARLHYDQPASSLTQRMALRLLRAARSVMTEALRQGGTSFDALYVGVNGESGTAQANLNVYGRQGLPCKRCGTPIVRERFMNRSSHFCLVCQRKR